LGCKTRETLSFLYWGFGGDRITGWGPEGYLRAVTIQKTLTFWVIPFGDYPTFSPLTGLALGEGVIKPSLP